MFAEDKSLKGNPLIQPTPKSLRLHIGLFGRRNSGKSTLMNALTEQDVSIVSATPGTTTDPVEKPFELIPLGPVVFIDTAGLDDIGALGALRIAKTQDLLARVDIAIIVIGDGRLGADETALIASLQAQHTPFVVAFNKADQQTPNAETIQALQQQQVETVTLSAHNSVGIDALKQALARLAPDVTETPSLLADLIAPGDWVVLVTPIDQSAPKGRLIQPQVQTLREVLDCNALAITVKEHDYARTLSRLAEKPSLVVTDSQVVRQIAAETPPDIRLTTFSILMARFKGDMLAFAEGARQIARLKANDRILIAEACSHQTMEDDIARVKIPKLLGKIAGGELRVDVCSGDDFPNDLSPYALVLQCGGCMATRKDILARQQLAKNQGVAMTNYGMAISAAQGALERTLGCFPEAAQAYGKF